MDLFGDDVYREGTCTRCGAAACVVNGVAMHEDGWRDDACYPSASEVISGARSTEGTVGA